MAGVVTSWGPGLRILRSTAAGDWEEVRKYKSVNSRLMAAKLSSTESVALEVNGNGTIVVVDHFEHFADGKELKAGWDRLKGKLIDKFGAPLKIVEEVLPPYEGRDFAKFAKTALQEGKATYLITWHDTSTNDVVVQRMLIEDFGSLTIIESYLGLEGLTLQGGKKWQEDGRAK